MMSVMPLRITIGTMIYLIKKEFFDGAIYVYLPIHIDIEGLRKLLKM